MSDKDADELKAAIAKKLKEQEKVAAKCGCAACLKWLESRKAENAK